MARVFKRSTVKGAPFYATWTETLPNGRTRKRTVSTRTPDKRTAEQILTKLKSDAAVRFHGLVDPMADRIATEANKPIETHLTDFKNKLVAAGRSRDHIDRTLMHIREYAAFSNGHCPADFTADQANKWAAKLADDDMAARTIQARLTSLKSFSSWLVKHDKLDRDPFASVSKPNPNADRRRERRMLLPTEWRWLMAGTAAGDDFRGCPPIDRQLIYRLAVQTGLRSSELRSLGRGHFHLDGKRPFVKVASKSTKNKQTAHQYVDPVLAADLAAHLSTKTPMAAAFALPTEYFMANMLRADLSNARVLWLRDADDPDERANREESLFLTPQNEAGETLDFHALRHSCGAWLAMRGVEAKVIQSVMRHCSITLTMDTYGHLIAGAEAAAVTANADLTAVPAIIAATEVIADENKGEFSATGTEDCFPFVSQRDGKRRNDDERRRNGRSRKATADNSMASQKKRQNDEPRTLMNVSEKCPGRDSNPHSHNGRGILSP
ncbi:site-specific tyrosine recombinase XerC [Novipirellula galeiformis]|uniref:Site-specific tyrosine recombinase XerC n=1 Tax=Novipirellula galeiformis TaxID=2528004 RepID=A0A5C6CEB6_9BACT|nr:tyrosine-type recombinase/integrase [Novipirellula galeiformis]TWU22442.1 site-specific tyrosine recombinase XerC [Novipirellula galeiformis]